LDRKLELKEVKRLARTLTLGCPSLECHSCHLSEEKDCAILAILWDAELNN
jgi:hypothetical protein